MLTLALCFLIWAELVSAGNSDDFSSSLFNDIGKYRDSSVKETPH